VQDERTQKEGKEKECCLVSCLDDNDNLAREFS